MLKRSIDPISITSYYLTSHLIQMSSLRLVHTPTKAAKILKLSLIPMGHTKDVELRRGSGGQQKMPFYNIIESRGLTKRCLFLILLNSAESP